MVGIQKVVGWIRALMGQWHMKRDKITLQRHLIGHEYSRITGIGQRRVTQANLQTQSLRLGGNRRPRKRRMDR